jgi:ubiquinone biosynthesis protein Coq4
MDDVMAKPAANAGQAKASGPAQTSAPIGPRVPLPGPNDDVRPRMGLTPSEQRYFQGDVLPATSSALISNSRYLNDPYYREAFATQALRRHGPDLPPTYMVPMMSRAIQEVTDFGRVMELLAEEKKRFPAFGEWLDRRHFPSFTREQLAKYPAGTLAAEIHAFLGIPGVDINFLSSDRTVASDLEYLGKAKAAQHDLEHMVSGFGANTAGENALAMLNVVSEARFFTPELATYMSASAVWVSSTGYTRTALHYHHVLPAYLDAMHRGIEAGLAIATPFFMNHWEDYLDWPLEDIAPHLGFKRGPGAEWDWTTEAATG